MLHRLMPRPAAALLVLIAATLLAWGAKAPAASANCRSGTEWRAAPDCPGRVGGTSADPVSVPGNPAHPQTAGFETHRDDCDAVPHWSVQYRQEDFGIWFRYYFVWARIVSGSGWRTSPAVLVCGNETHPVWGITAGPGADGVSVPCPELRNNPRPYPRTHPNHVGWWVSESRHFTQNRGSFGHNSDGFWHYKLYNPWAGTIHAELEGICTSFS